MRISKPISATIFLVAFVSAWYTEGTVVVDPVTPLIPVVSSSDPSYEEMQADIRKMGSWSKFSACFPYSFEYEECSTGCISFRVKCADESNNYAHCVDYEENCATGAILYVLIGLFVCCCCVCFGFAYLRSKSSFKDGNYARHA